MRERLAKDKTQPRNIYLNIRILRFILETVARSKTAFRFARETLFDDPKERLAKDKT
jgi:hypothetical protein